MLLLRAVAMLVCATLLVAQTPAGESGKQPERESRFPEVEFVASDVFRSGSYIQPIWKRAHFEGHYFGGQTNVGYTGGSWAFRVKELVLAPGLGVSFGDDHFTTTPAVAFRWEFEKSWFVTQGLVFQCFRKSPLEKEEEGGHEAVVEDIRPTISDGNHVSVRWKRVTLGGTWEHIQFREEEWKGGGRLAIRLVRHVSAVLYVLGPGRAEFRAGVLIRAKPD